MSGNDKVKFPTGVCFIPSLGIIQSPDSTQKLNQSEQNILMFLIDNHDRPVTKEELLKSGWPERAVTEASLFQVIRALRIKLQESRKGEVIETLPRVGYQITQFEQVAFSPEVTSPQKTKLQASKRWRVLAFTLLLATIGLGTYLWLNHFKPPKPVRYLTRTEQWDNSTMTMIATNSDDLTDLTEKLERAYKKHKLHFTPDKIDIVKAYAYKGDGLYSIAWCQIDNNRACIPLTDYSYTAEEEDWDKLADFLAFTEKKVREEPIIQSDLAREPTSQVFMHYIDDSGVQSKIIHHYVSKDQSGDLNYSYMSFITEHATDFHHALSIRAATLSIVENHSPFLSTAELKPDMFHWAYQPNELIKEDESTAILTESRLRANYKAKHIVNSYLLYQQPYLDLIFYPRVGIYWVHNSKKYTKLFDNKRYTQESKQSNTE